MIISYCIEFISLLSHFFFFFFNDTATTEIYTLSLHDALPIWGDQVDARDQTGRTDDVHQRRPGGEHPAFRHDLRVRSEEHTSELQSRLHLVCRLLLEKKKQRKQKQLQTRHIKHISNSTRPSRS